MLVYVNHQTLLSGPEDFIESNARQTYRTAQMCQMEVEDWDGEIILKLSKGRCEQVEEMTEGMRFW
jgi:hypothetical protein